jgi:hypothetical protein
MPYIKLSDRNKFEKPIAEILGILSDNTDNFYTKGEYFAYFVNRCVKRFLSDPEYVQNSFNSAFFNESKKKSLSNAADSIAALINRSDPIAGAGDLNYAISSVIWGFLGEAKGFHKIGYGIRAYLDGILEKIKESVETVNNGSQKDSTMAFRRHLVIKGVLSHIMKETYRLKTVPYEQGKIEENGDVWVDGKLNLGLNSDE